MIDRTRRSVPLWASGTYVLGHCDYSDSDDGTGGFDINVADWQRRPRSVETDRGAGVERMEGAEGIIVVLPDGQLSASSTGKVPSHCSQREGSMR